MDFKECMDRLFGQRIRDTVDDGVKRVDARAESLKGTAEETRKEVESVVRDAEKVAGFFQGAGPDLIALLAKTEGRIIVVPVVVGGDGHIIVDGRESCRMRPEVDQALRDELFQYNACALRCGIQKGKTYQFIAMLVPKEGA